MAGELGGVLVACMLLTAIIRVRCREQHTCDAYRVKQVQATDETTDH